MLRGALALAGCAGGGKAITIPCERVGSLSEPITITPPEASALRAPVARAFMTSVWAPEGPDEDALVSYALVSYASAAEAHRGVFVQPIRCTPFDD